MATSASATIQVIVKANVTNTLDLQTAQAPVTYNKTFTFTDGTGANQFKDVWTDTRTAAGSDDLDLAGSLTNAYGNTITFTAIKAIMIYATDASAAIGGAAATQFVNWVADATDVVNIPSGGMLLLVAPDATGYAVGAGTADLLRVTMTGTYDIVILGET